MSHEIQPRRPSHLMDPNAPRQVRDVAAAQRSLSNVQKWVMSVLAVTTILHLSIGLVIAAVTLDSPRPGAEIGLCVIAGAFGMIAIAVGLFIHERKPLSPWLLLGLIPTAVGLWWVLR